MNPNNPGAPAGVPVKRKRGRPRKDETQAHAIDKSTPPLNKPVLRPMVTRTQVEASATPKPVPNIPIASKGKDHIEVDADQGTGDDHNNDEMVGQVVTGILESAFDAGYFLTVRVGDSDVHMRGVVFKEDCVVPITPDNDIAPNAKMYERRDTPIPMKLAPQVAETAGNSSSRPTENIEEHHPQPQPQPQPLPQPLQQMPIEGAPQPLPQLQPQPKPQPQQPQPQLQPQSQPQPQPYQPQHQQQQQQSQPLQHVPIDSVPQNEVQNVVLLQGQLGIPLNIGQPQLPQEQDKLSVDKQQSVGLEEHDRQNPQVVFNLDSQEMKSLAEEPSFEPGLGVVSLEQNVEDSFLEEPVIFDGGEKEKAPESSEPVQKGDQVVVREDNASQFVNEPHCDSQEKQSSPRNEGPEESSEPLVKLQKTEEETANYAIVQPLNDAVPGDQNPESSTSITAAKTDEIAAAILPMEVLIQPAPTFTAEEPFVVPQVVEPEIGSASGFQISMENTDNDEPQSENPMETG